MVSPNVSKILEAVEVLSDEERKALLRLLEQRVASSSGLTREQQIDQVLRDRGVVRTVPPKRTPETIARLKAWKPIKMPGGPLSEELIRDRR